MVMGSMAMNTSGGGSNHKRQLSPLCPACGLARGSWLAILRNRPLDQMDSCCALRHVSTASQTMMLVLHFTGTLLRLWADTAVQIFERCCLWSEYASLLLLPSNCSLRSFVLHVTSVQIVPLCLRFHHTLKSSVCQSC